MKKIFLLLVTLMAGMLTGTVVGQDTPTNDSITVCGGKLYTVGKGALLDLSVGQADQPATVPECAEGMDALKSYYRLHSIKDGRGAGLIFKVSVAFLVNCEGNVVEWKLITSHPGKTMNELANKVLDEVRQCPLRWQPATDADGNAVDCWQVLDFSVVETSLANCSYVR